MALSWSLGDLCSAATRRIGHRADLSLSDCSYWANQAKDDLTRDCPELLSERTAWFSVNSGTSLLTVPADFYEAINFSWQTTLRSGLTLRQIDPSYADSQGYFPVGEPQGYFIFNDRFQLWPSADSSENTAAASSGRSYQLRYRALTATMTATSDHPSIHTAHRIGILYKLEEYLNDLVGNAEESAAASIRYQGYVASLKDAKARRDADKGGFRASVPERRGRGSMIGNLSDQDDWRRR